jgi:hypothetical protein
MSEQLDDIDALVAEKVMGWERLEVNYFGTEDETPRQKELEQWLTDVGINSVGDYWIDVGRKFWMPIYGWHGWQPTRNIAQAWQALEKFPVPRYYVRLLTTETGNWRCDIELRGGDGPVVSAYDKSAPLAICLCALKAVGGADGEGV